MRKSNRNQEFLVSVSDATRASYVRSVYSDRDLGARLPFDLHALLGKVKSDSSLHLPKLHVL